MPTTSTKPLLDCLNGQTQAVPPVWLMRQAGRYLPEYRALRTEALDFLTLCFTPDLASEVTLQPIIRYAMDGAILFSDILVIPYALGQSVSFVPGKGPVLAALSHERDIPVFDADRLDKTIRAVYQTVSQVKKRLPAACTLIGFCGGPWTVATYMIEGGSSRDFQQTKTWAFREPRSFSRLIDVICDASIAYLSGQIEAGADAIKIFDSWAGVLPPADFAKWVIVPTVRIVTTLRDQYPHVPIIGFPRGAGAQYVDYLAQTGVQGIAIDSGVPPAWAATQLQGAAAVQGNLDPIHLLAGGDTMEREIATIRDALGKGRFIFNLGHGVVPQTPPEHVAALVAAVRAVSH